MSKGTRYTTEFKQEAVNQVIKHGYSVNDVSERLGISSKTLYAWTKTFSKPPKQRDNEQDLQTQIAQLQRELKRVQQERYLKGGSISPRKTANSDFVVA